MNIKQVNNQLFLIIFIMIQLREWVLTIKNLFKTIQNKTIIIIVKANKKNWAIIQWLIYKIIKIFFKKVMSFFHLQQNQEKLIFFYLILTVYQLRSNNSKIIAAYNRIIKTSKINISNNLNKATIRILHPHLFKESNKCNCRLSQDKIFKIPLIYLNIN